MNPQESLVLVLIATLSLAAVYLLIRMFARTRGGPRVDGVRIGKRQVGTSWHLSLSSSDLPRGLSVGTPPASTPPDLVPIREGLAAWGLSARRRFKDGTTLRDAWTRAQGQWSLADQTLQCWVRLPRGPGLTRQLDAHVAEGLALIRLMRSGDPGQ
jgi:hypothetical protein